MNFLHYLREKSKDIPAIKTPEIRFDLTKLYDLDLDAFFVKHGKQSFTKFLKQPSFTTKQEEVSDPRILRAQLLERTLAPYAGQELGMGDWFLLSQYHIDEFAKLSGDTQWIHTDPERAKKESPYRSTVAHGFLILSLLPELAGINDIGERFYPDAKFVIHQGLNHVNFLYPVKPGVSICASTVLISCVRHNRRADIIYRITAKDNSAKGHTICEVDVVIKVSF